MTEQTIKVKTQSISIPMISADMPGYKSRNVSLKFDPNQLDALYRLFHALNLTHAKLINGKTVSTPYHAIQWLLEKISDTVPSQPVAAVRSNDLPGGVTDDSIEL